MNIEMWNKIEQTFNLVFETAANNVMFSLLSRSYKYATVIIPIIYAKMLSAIFPGDFLNIFTYKSGFSHVSV